MMKNIKWISLLVLLSLLSACSWVQNPEHLAQNTGAVELDTDNNQAIDLNLGGTNAKTAALARVNLDAQQANANLDTISSGTDAQKRALIDAAAKPIATLADLQDEMPDFAGDVRYVKGRTSDGDGYQGTFVWSTADLSTEVTADTLHGIYVAPTSDPTGESGAWVRQSGLLTENITVTVGTSGHFATINAAIEFLSTFQPDYRNTGVTATVHLLAGFVMAEQVLVRGTDLGWITITGADVETVITHTALTVAFDYGASSYPAFGVSKGGVLPQIGQLFRFSVTGAGGVKNGIMAVDAGSSANILPNCGVRDAGHIGIYAAGGSIVNARLANFSGANTFGIYAEQGSTVNVESADITGAGTYGILATNGSTVNAAYANVTGAGATSIYPRYGSMISARSATGTLSQSANTLTSNGIIFQ